MSTPHQPQRPNRKESQPLKDYAKYSGIAIKMILIMLMGAFSGIKLDQYLNTQPILTVIFVMTFVFLALYSVIRDVTKN